MGFGRARDAHLLAAVPVVHAEERGVIVESQDGGVRVLLGGEGWGRESARARESGPMRRIAIRGGKGMPWGCRALRTSMFVRQPCIAVVPYLNRVSSPSLLSLSVMGWLR